MTGLIIANIFLLIFIGFFIKNKNFYLDERSVFVKLEIASWILGSFSAIILISSTVYTIWVLKKLYGSDFSSTSWFMFGVLAIFCLEFFSRTAYEWTMFHFLLSK